MGRPRVLLLALVILIALSAVIAVYIKLQQRSPTPFNWRPHANTVAGNGSPAFLDVPQATQAGFCDPFGIAIAPDGTIYISDAGDSNRIRKLTREGGLVTLAGESEGFADGSQSSFNTPSGLAIGVDGNIYVADTGNNRVRMITPEGVVSTVAGNGKAGYVDGPASSSQFDGPLGVAVDVKNNIYVADTYNDRIRKISVDGQVTTLAGSGRPGDADGDAASARFDTPSGIVVSPDQTVIVADTGNNKLRKIAPTGQVTTLPVAFESDSTRTYLRSPLGLALTHDGFLYVTEFERGTIVQVAPSGKACVLAGSDPGYADGFAVDARFNHPAGLAIDPRNGDLVVADGANYLVRRLAHDDGRPLLQASTELLPRLTPQTLGEKNLLWPLDPQDRPHEVVATMGEVRGSFDSTDSRDHLHSGLDVAGGYGDVVRAIRSEKVTGPLANWGFGELSEGMRVAVISYIHIHVGRDKDGNVFSDPRFVAVKNDDGKLAYVRVRRGARFGPGDAIGTVNRMYHVHLIVGPSGGVINPFSLSPIGFKDTIAPTIETDGIQLFDEGGTRLTKREDGRLMVHGRISIVVDAFDRTDLNGDRRRLGLYSLGYQVFKASPEASSNAQTSPRFNPAPGFDSPRVTVIFNRLPSDNNASKLAYAQESGITVYGNKTTRFLYEITNTVRDGHSRAGLWDTSELPKGDYVLRIIVADYSGNEAQRDVLIRID
jgi:sugar lactone lactonase YvrE